MFLQASVCQWGGLICLSACWDNPSRSRPPQEQTPHQSRHTPGGDTPRSRHPHRADTPQEQKPLPQIRHSPQEQTPWSRHPLPGADTPWDQTPPWEQTPPWSRHPLGVDTDDNFVKRNTKLSAVMDQGFLRRDANPKMGCQPIIWSKFVENCMDIKKIGLGCPWCPLGSATGQQCWQYCHSFLS